ncbi:MAG: hypothetical protein JWM97_643 [Phycisphaerales bacterium]|nr:hypothetical protein [Phycisphaerales bacterium]
MGSDTHATKQAGRIATWLPRLAERADVVAASSAIWHIAIDAASKSEEKSEPAASREEEDARGLSGYKLAIELIGDQVEKLIPAWISRFLEQLQAANDEQQRRVAAIGSDEDVPSIDMANIIAVNQLQKVLQATGDRIDPHIEPIVDAMGSWDRDRDEQLCASVEYAGPAISRAIPKLLEMLRVRSVWCWPSHLSRALANASRFDGTVIGSLREMLSSDLSSVREAAISVLGTIGPAAQSSADQLLAFRNGNEAERCGMLHALARQGSPTAEILDLFAAAMVDENGYVRRAAVYAVGELTPEPERFVPLLIDACDYPHHLHDTSLPEAAVDALAKYGPRARAALPRLEQFVTGPIKGRTVPAKQAFRAIERISPEAPPVRRSEDPTVRAEPVSDDEPLFGVIHEGNRCYIDRSGRVVIRTDFEWGEDFSDGLAIVRRSGGTSVIDRKGRVVFESTWDEIKPFCEGLAAVKKDKKWGFVDVHGKLVIEPQYDAVTRFSEGLAGFEVGRTEGSFAKTLTIARPGLRGFIDRTGGVVIPPIWPDARAFHDGRALVCTGGTMKPNPLIDDGEMLADRKYGYIDRTGRLVIAGVYGMFSHSFSEGLAAVHVGDGFSRVRYGYIDANGREVIPLTLKSATSFSGGVALVSRRGRKYRSIHFVIDPTGRVLTELAYPMVEAFSEGFAAAWNGNSYGFLDVTGRWSVEPQFDQCEPFKNGLAWVQRGDWYGLIDTTGKFVWGPTTEGAVARVLESDWTS